MNIPRPDPRDGWFLTAVSLLFRLFEHPTKRSNL